MTTSRKEKVPYGGLLGGNKKSKDHSWWVMTADHCISFHPTVVPGYLSWTAIICILVLRGMNFEGVIEKKLEESELVSSTSSARMRSARSCDKDTA